MTRINVVPPSELCDQHLLAEFRELTRIPNAVVSGKAVVKDIPAAYTLGKGHVKFFYDKLAWLCMRYGMLYSECANRGFNVSWIFPHCELWPEIHIVDWQPTPEALAINRQRIAERMPAKARWTAHK